ncbi:hypothetical protein DFH11DRAFT_1727359 [Phellopilus nigrolimitatus]|nr:hypothetical protein DFH11DRAFT_1727359 [Phellopilus nigrolimitatus]
MASQSHPSESISTLDSTPYSNKLNSNANVDSQHESQKTIDTGIDPYIKHDLAGRIKVSFDKFLAAFSGQPPEHALVPDPEVSSIAQDSEIGRLRDLYCNSARDNKRTNAEKLRYGPFVNLANAVLKALNNGEDPPIVFVRNDPHHLMGEAGIQRVPDVVVVNSKLESVKDGKWREYSNQNSKTSYNTRWTWHQVLFTLEFKLSVPVIELTGSDVQSNPPETSQQQPPILSTHSFSNDDYPTFDAASSHSPPDVVSPSSHALVAAAQQVVFQAARPVAADRTAVMSLATGIPVPQTSSAAQVTVNEVSVASAETQFAVFDAGSSKPNVSSGASTSTEGGFSVPVRPRRNGKSVVRASTDQSDQPRKGKGRASRRSATPSSAPGVESTSSGGDKRPFSREIGLEEQRPKKLRSEPSPEIEPVDLELSGPGLRNMGPPPPPASEYAANKRKSTKCIPDEVPDDLLRQAARYAIDQFAFSHNLRHIFNMQVVDGRLWIAYYDHTGVILTEKCISFVDDLDSFVLLLKAMLNMKKGDRGVLEQLQMSREIVAAPEAPASPEWVWSLSVPGHTIVLRNSLARVKSYGLLGRASAVDSCFMICKEDCVEKERCGGRKNKLYAVKRSWPAKSRESEVDIIEKGRKALEILDADAGFRETHAIKGNLVDRLPTVHFSADLDDLEGRGFRAKLGVFLGDLENRVWRVIVFDILVPIHDLEDINDFKQCIRDIFQGTLFVILPYHEY